MKRYSNYKIENLIGKTFKEIKKEREDLLVFVDTDDNRYVMYHDQKCCEEVYIEDICGNLDYLIGSPIVMAEEVKSNKPIEGQTIEGSFTWTFYKFATAKGYVTIRWFGQSNGYYSEEADFVIIDDIVDINTIITNFEFKEKEVYETSVIDANREFIVHNPEAKLVVEDDNKIEYIAIGTFEKPYSSDHIMIILNKEGKKIINDENVKDYRVFITYNKLSKNDNNYYVSKVMSMTVIKLKDLE